MSRGGDFDERLDALKIAFEGAKVAEAGARRAYYRLSHEAGEDSPGAKAALEAWWEATLEMHASDWDAEKASEGEEEWDA